MATVLVRRSLFVRSSLRGVAVSLTTQPLAPRIVIRALSSGTLSSQTENSSSTKQWNMKLLTLGLAAGFGFQAVLSEGKDDDNKEKEGKDENEEIPELEVRKAKTFRDKQIADYEDRIRHYSEPDKVFRYFATVEIEGVVYMRPEDFIRSITPGELQPKKYGLDLFEKLPASAGVIKGTTHAPFEHNTETGDLAAGLGLISFPEYLFLLTALCTPKRQFEIAFRMFDLDGNGIVDFDEFSKVQIAVLRKTAVGKKLGIADTSSVAQKGALARSHMLQKFFGAKGEEKLDFQAFEKFVDQLQSNVLHLEFLKRSGGEKTISEKGFTDMLLKHARLSKEQRPAYYKRVKAAYTKKDGDEGGFSFDEVQSFFQVLYAIDDIDMALRMVDSSGASITEADFQRAVKSVTGLSLGSHVVHFIFILFDQDGDGELNHKEFVKIMKNARGRGLNESRDLGVVRGLSALRACVAKQLAEASAES